MVRTAPSHGANRGSIPLGATDKTRMSTSNAFSPQGIERAEGVGEPRSVLRVGMRSPRATGLKTEGFEKRAIASA